MERSSLLFAILILLLIVMSNKNSFKNSLDMTPSDLDTKVKSDAAHLYRLGGEGHILGKTLVRAHCIVFVIKLIQAKTVLEIGFNMGHSTFTILNNCPSVQNYYAYDICHHSYVKPSYDLIKKQFSHINLQLICGDSQQTLLSNDNNIICDFIHIDGGHTVDIAYNDIINCKKFSNPHTIVCIDDCGGSHRMEGVCAAITKALNKNIISIILPGFCQQGQIFCRYN